MGKLTETKTGTKGGGRDGRECGKWEELGGKTQEECLAGGGEIKKLTLHLIE